MKFAQWPAVLFLLIFPAVSCYSQNMVSEAVGKDISAADVKVGAERTEIYFPWIKGKRIAVVANQTSMIKNTHLVDSLLNAGFDVKKVFCPEHGFRGNAEAGENIGDSADEKTKLPIISLYGKNKKPKSEDLKNIDVVLFDIQDVGARFYTYISTMHYVMEACAEHGKLFIILDRPNPNGYYIDGPVLDKKYTSFVGMHPVPIVHGMTLAEYACMINGEGWLNKGIQCQLMYVPVFNYNHTYLYQLPQKPSPNLPTMESVYLYPTFCLFEGTCISVGRGTDRPFEIIGHPMLDSTDFSFVPKSIPGMATNPLYEGKMCFGYDFHTYAGNYIKGYGKLYLFPLLELYRRLKDRTDFFNENFDRLAGTSTLREQIISGKNEDEIRKSWQPEIDNFKKIRKKYLLYTDFE